MVREERGKLDFLQTLFADLITWSVYVLHYATDELSLT